MKLEHVSNRQLTLLRKLNQKKYRLKEQLFLVEGARAVAQIIQNGQLTVNELFFDESQVYWQQQLWEKFLADIPSSIIEKETFAKVSDTDSPQGVMALCRMPEEANLEEMVQGKGIILATDAIQDPGNLGTIIRTATWFGVRGLLNGKGTVDLFHPKVVRSTAGATGTVPYVSAILDDVLPVLEKEGWQTILLDAGADSVPLQKIKKAEKMILVIGNEGNGIDQSLFGSNRLKARIASPREEKNVESLNAAIATSIALYAFSKNICN